MWFSFLRLSLLISVLAFAVVMLPFWKPIFWGITVAIIFSPIERIIFKYIKNKNFSSFMATMLAIVAVALPVTFAILIMVGETEKFISNITLIKNTFNDFVIHLHEWSKIKALAPYVNKIDATIFSLLKQTGLLLTKNIGTIFSGTYSVIVGFIFSFIVSFFLLRDGDKFITYLSKLVDDEDNFNRVLKSIKESMRATVIGGVLTAFIQGFVGAVGFFIVGLNAFFMWLFLIALFSFLPLVGTAVIWIPVAIYLIIVGKYAMGIFILLWGIFAIGLVDNYVRPVIISSRIHIHPMILFFGILGAIVVFGPIGIIAGPVIVSIADAVIRAFIESKQNH